MVQRKARIWLSVSPLLSASSESNSVAGKCYSTQTLAHGCDLGVFDTHRAVQHSWRVLRLGTRLFVTTLAVLLGAGNLSVCGGWKASAEARMACCADHHHGHATHGGSDRVGHDHADQLRADSCCASSEDDTSTNPSLRLVAVMSMPVTSTSVLLPPTIPSSLWTGGSRTESPPPTPPVPKHVLLSVFLV